jgi:type I restriction enzyme M protein
MNFKYFNEISKNIILKIIPNFEISLNFFKEQVSKIEIYEKEDGKFYLKSYDNIGKEKLIFNKEKNKGAPEEIVRQLLLYELIDEKKYPINKVEIEKSVVFGREVRKKKVDIVIYQNDFKTAWIICEVKAIGQKNNLQQFKSYINGEGSPIGIATNGEELLSFLRPYPKQFESLGDTIVSFDDYLRVEKSNEPLNDLLKILSKKPFLYDDLIEINKKQSPNLKKIIEDLEELVLANSGVDVFMEIFKLIYAKLYDEWSCEMGEKEELKFRKQFNSGETFKEISDLFEKSKKQWNNIFEEGDKIKLSKEHLQICVASFEKIKLFGSNLRIIDEAFEYLVPEVSKSKKGQYFTPRPIIDLCVLMLKPKNKEYVIDPSCGSAGFLIHTMIYIWNKYKMKNYQAKSNYAKRYLYGIDFDEKSAKISKAIMLIAGDGKSHIYKENSLEFYKWNETLISNFKENNLIEDGNKNLKFDLVLANPPFAGEIQEQDLIRSYKDILGEKERNKISRHILFIQRILDMLKEDGRCAIVLPQGIFNNTNEKYIREFLFEKARILAVVGLHENSFKPHTGTKTSIIFLRKYTKEQKTNFNYLKNYEIPFFTSKVSFKNNSGDYVFLKDESGREVLASEDEFPYFVGNPVYNTDLFLIAKAFENWGLKQLKKKDKIFDFLEDK